MEEQPNDLGLQKSVNLDRGIFIVRYSAAEDEAFPPKVTVGLGRGSNTAVIPILHPDAPEPVLWRPGAALVVQAIEAGVLLVHVFVGADEWIGGPALRQGSKDSGLNGHQGRAV